MPASSPEVAIFPEHRFALSQPRGRVTGDVVVEYGRQMAFAEGWQPGFTEIWDLTFCQAVDLVPSDIPKLTAVEDETKAELEGSRTLVISSRAPVLFAVSFYARLMKPRGREVVGLRTQAEAAALLGIDGFPVLGG